MSQTHTKGETGTMIQKSHLRRSLVGPGARERCFSNMIAKISCEIHQPSPGCPETLLPSVQRVLCLWRDREYNNEYRLSAIKEDKDDVFVDLLLSKLQTGELKYSINYRWHEVTVTESDFEKPRRFGLHLEPSAPDGDAQVKDFNRALQAVFEEILNSAGEGGEASLTCEGGERNPAAKDGTPLGEKGLTQSTEVQAQVRMGEVLVAAGTEMASRQAMNKQASFPPQSLEQDAMSLAMAIHTGNVQAAMELATKLAQAHTNLSIKYDHAAEEQKAREQEISVTVHVEDRESPGVPLDIKVKPSSTIMDLKRLFLGKHGFPVEVQKWIIGKRIPGDEETLIKCDVTTSGHTLYLYLLNIRAVDPSREIERRHWQGHAGPGSVGSSSAPRSRQESDYETMNFPINNSMAGTPSTGASTPTLLGPDPNLASQRVQGPPPTGTGGAMRQQSQLSTASSATSLSANSFGLSDLRGTLDLASGPNSESQRGSDVRGGGAGIEGIVSGLGQMVVTGGGSGVVEHHPLQSSSVDRRLGQEQESVQGWQCPQCTLINQPTRPGCEACGNPRPPEYKVPSDFIVSDEERQRLERERQMEAFLKQEELREREHNYQRLLQADSSELVSNTEVFTCPICFDDIDINQGIVLRECLHQFCRTCLTDTVRLAEEAELKCPFQDDSYKCDALLQDREVRALVPDHVYERYLRRSLDVAESRASNSYHCKTPDCRGWCIYEDMVNFFHCPVCRHENCLTCRAIHENQNCKQYQEDLRVRAANDKAALKTQIMLQEMLDKGEAMHCPQCEVIVQKKDGCDWIRCSFCKTEICWVTKGPRWGPKGEGDTSAGCKCRVGGRRCHPKCTNCH